MIALGLAGRPSYFGARVARVEDDRLLHGGARFVADIRLPRMVEMTVVRSLYAHAHIAVDLARARADESVVAAYAAADLEGVRPFPDFIQHMKPVACFPLARERVRYVGAPVAVVVAADRYHAEDGAELVDVDYEPLAVAASAEAALAEGAPKLYDAWPDNRIVDLPSSDETEEIFAAHRVVSGRFAMHRHGGVPIETRGCVAEYRDGRLTLYTGTQSPHITRSTLAFVLPLKERDIHVVAPDVGGSFGVKTHVYPEEVLVSWLAMKLGRPVRWIEDRSEHLMASCQARNQTMELEAAVRDDGTIAALRCHLIHDVGSGEIFMPGINPTFVTAGQIAGAYRIPVAECSITQVVTNKTPSGAYRGFGQPEAYFALEVLVDKIARELGIDAVDLRRRMLLDDADLPYTNPTGGIIDSGSFVQAFDRAVELGRAAEATRRAEHAADPHVRIGLGLATYLEGTAPSYFGTTGRWTAHDSARIRIEPDGSVVVSVGVTTSGQGTTTMAAVLTADALGVELESVRVESGDTDASPYGLGAWGSRSTVVGGGAILTAATVIREKVRRIAAHMLEVAPEDLEVEQGFVRVRGAPEREVSVAEVATAAWMREMDLPEDIDAGLDTVATFQPPMVDHEPGPDGKMNAVATWANATHAVVVKVDLETGGVEVLDYIAVHDCGPMVNPPIVEGQIQGGVAQEIGGTLYEHMAYSQDAQPLAASFMDYLLPTATEIPSIVVEHFESPSPNMPLGLKGAGEGGTIGPPAAITNAVTNALAEFDVQIDTLPLSPSAVRELIRTGSGASR